MRAALENGDIAADVQSLAMEIAEKLANDDSLQKQTNLRRSMKVRSKIRRLWQLMVVESREHAPTDDQDLSRATHIAVLHGQSGSPRDRDADGEVTRAGYRMLHMRIAKVLIPAGAVNLDGSSAAFDEHAAEKLADQDWDDDIARFSGSSHIMTWLDTIRTKFRDASERAVTEHGFRVLFERLDEDGSGGLSLEEFDHVVRKDVGMDCDALSDAEVRSLFEGIDQDSTGSIEAAEFVAWLWAADSPIPVIQPSHRTGADIAGSMVHTVSKLELKSRLKKKSIEASQVAGWQAIFEQCDQDGSGELSMAEFSRAVREIAGLDASQIPETEMEELFRVVDADESGAIDAAELRVLLTANLETASMTFAPFHASIFELCDLWVEEEDDEEKYCHFCQRMFEEISEPVNGHTTAEDLAEVPVFDEPEPGVIVPNFRLRRLEDIGTVVGSDGSLLETTEDSAAELSRISNSLSSSSGEDDIQAVLSPRPARRERRLRRLTDAMENSPVTPRPEPEKPKTHAVADFALSPMVPLIRPGTAPGAARGDAGAFQQRHAKLQQRLTTGRPHGVHRETARRPGTACRPRTACTAVTPAVTPARRPESVPLTTQLGARVRTHAAAAARDAATSDCPTSGLAHNGDTPRNLRQAAHWQ